MGYIRGICISKERGTAKHEVESAKFIPDWGIEGDAHCRTLASTGEPPCHWKRSMKRSGQQGADVAFRSIWRESDRGRL